MQPHITEWHSPTDTNIHKLLVRIATNISIVAIMVVTVSNMRGETLLKKTKYKPSYHQTSPIESGE